MKEYVMIPFQVKEDKLEEAKQAIRDLIANVKEHEPLTLMYQSVQMRDDPTSFIHFIVFANNDAHMIHRKAAYVSEFVKRLYSLCPKEPFPLFLDSFDGCGAAVDAMDKR